MPQCVRLKDVAGSFVDDVRGPAPMVTAIERSFKEQRRALAQSDGLEVLVKAETVLSM